MEEKIKKNLGYKKVLICHYADCPSNYNTSSPINLFIHTALDKGGSQINIFLISQQKHRLWVLIRSASVRHF